MVKPAVCGLQARVKQDPRNFDFFNFSTERSEADIAELCRVLAGLDRMLYQFMPTMCCLQTAAPL